MPYCYHWKPTNLTLTTVSKWAVVVLIINLPNTSNFLRRYILTNRGENDASTKPELRTSAKHNPWAMIRGQAGFFWDAPFARNSRFAVFSRLPRVFLAFASLLLLPPWNTQKIKPILKAKVAPLALKIWHIFMVSETRLVMLLPLKTKLVGSPWQHYQI